MSQFVALWFWGTLVGLDLVSVGQIMIARPLVAGAVAGLIVGDPVAGGTIGILLELFAVDVLPVGAVRYPDYGLGAVTGTAVAAGAPSLLGIGLAIAIGLVVAHLGQIGTGFVRRWNTDDVRRNAAALEDGDLSAVGALQRRGLVRDASRAAVVMVVGLTLAALATRVPLVTVRGALLATVAVIGAAIGTAAAGAMRLAGRGFRLKWLVLGLLAGTIGVIAT